MIKLQTKKAEFYAIPANENLIWNTEKFIPLGKLFSMEESQFAQLVDKELCSWVNHNEPLYIDYLINKPAYYSPEYSIKSLFQKNSIDLQKDYIILIKA